ncbi:hypothetical protein ACFC06_25715 [Nocardia sp. NPDC056064]|uniref:hypothetical protein n=1 Tax=Nocardia sp. NPDC056064 TaxID=3345701 RepID=UPI0035D64CED
MSTQTLLPAMLILAAGTYALRWTRPALRHRPTTSLAIRATSLAGTWWSRPPATGIARPTHQGRRS